MKKIITFSLSVILFFSFFAFETNAKVEESFVPYVVNFELTFENDIVLNDESNVRATGLITSYGLSLSKTGTTLNINGRTHGIVDVVRCGFKDLTIQRRKSSDYTWEDYYEFGNVYVDHSAANLDTTLVVASGYQYRISCKHYAKKSLLVTQSISNTSGIVTVS